MEALKEKILEIISRHCAEQQSAAYEELVCNELFGDYNSKTEPIIKELLNSMANDNLIDINGDRICVKLTNPKRTCDVLILYKSLDELKDSINNKEKAFYDIKSVDVGHGCNIEATCFFCETLRYLPQLIPLLINTGIKLGEVVESYKGYQSAYDLIRNIFKKDSESNHSEEFRLNDNILASVAMTEIFRNYDIDIEKLSEVKLLHHNKTKIGTLGFYAIQNEGYNENHLEGTPDSINYFTFQFKGDNLPGDYTLATCEILSSGQVRYLSLNPITFGENLSNLT